MALETGTYIDDLDSANPTASDNVSQGDDHIRLLKSTIKATLPNLTGPVTATQAELNILDGATVTVSELNILDGATVTAAQLNQIDTGQFAFPATQNASADVNTLDDYEEGTFSPSLWDTSLSDAFGQTYSANNGSYTKIGNRVYFDAYIVVSSLGSLAAGAAAKIGNLPFTSNATANFYSSVLVGYGNALALPVAQDQITGYISPGTAYINLQKWSATGGTTAVLISHITAAGVLMLSGSYRV